MLRAFKVTLSILVAMTTYDFCHIKTKGFALVNILPTHYDSFESSVDKEGIDQILSQPFYLFARGGQTYVFKSQDDEYVLKLFKFQHLRIPPIVEFLPLSGPLGRKKELKKAYKKSQLEKTYQSYKDAFYSFKEDAELVELNISNQPGRYHSIITIFDAQNIGFKLDPNSTPFILQKKADSFEKKVLQLLEKKDFDSAYLAINDLLRLLAKRVNLGFVDNDAYLYKNFGIIGLKPILIDIGTLEKVEGLDLPSKVSQIKLVVGPLLEEASKYPELKTRIDAAFDALKASTLLDRDDSFVHVK